MQSNRRIIITSLVTVMAAGAIGVGMAQAKMGNNNMRRDDVIHAVERENDGQRMKDFRCDLDRSDIDQKKMFSAITRAHELRQSGDLSGARAILEDAGIEGMDRMQESKRKRCGIKDALDQQNWEMYKEHVRGSKMEKIVDNEEKFHTLVEARALRLQGRRAEAPAILGDMRYAM
jgi:hypothetical protein